MITILQTTLRAEHRGYQIAIGNIDSLHYRVTVSGPKLFREQHFIYPETISVFEATQNTIETINKFCDCGVWTNTYTTREVTALIKKSTKWAADTMDQRGDAVMALEQVELWADKFSKGEIV